LCAVEALEPDEPTRNAATCSVVTTPAVES
jgi:hypothetical protein